MKKEYVIGLHRGVNTDKFWEDIESITNLDTIPNRQVEVANRRVGSNRLTHYYLTDQEADLIRKDKRVYCVEIPVDQRDDIVITNNSIQTENFTRANNWNGSSVDAEGAAVNWGLFHSRFQTNPYGTDLDISGSYYYTLDGTGVDVVIQDSGIQANHPEFQNYEGISRVKQIDWYSAGGLNGPETTSNPVWYLNANEESGSASKSGVCSIDTDGSIPVYIYYYDYNQNKNLSAISTRELSIINSYQYNTRVYTQPQPITSSEWSLGDNPDQLFQGGNKYYGASKIGDSRPPDYIFILLDNGYMTLNSGNLLRGNWDYCNFIRSYQGSGFYSDYDGHGTHVASIIAGKTYGFAKNANIYSQKISGLVGSGDPNSGISTSDAFDTLRLWHANKTNKRPTIVNISWGYETELSAGGITEINYRGTSYTTSSGDPIVDYGIATYNTESSWKINTRVNSIDVELQEVIDAGIYIINSAGNLNYKCEVSGGVDYDNYFTHEGTNYYYHRGASPYDKDALLVGSINYAPYDADTEQKSGFSNAGPAVNIWSPGHFIMGAGSNNMDNTYTTSSYYKDNRFNQIILSGTSQAAAQVTGVSSLILQLSPKTPLKSIRDSLISNAGTFLKSGDSNDYTSGSIMGSSSKILYNIYGQKTSPGNFNGQNISLQSSFRVPTGISETSRITNKTLFDNNLLYKDITPFIGYKVGNTTYNITTYHSVDAKNYFDATIGGPTADVLLSIDNLEGTSVVPGTFTKPTDQFLTSYVLTNESGSSSGISWSRIANTGDTNVFGYCLKHLYSGYDYNGVKSQMFTSTDGITWKEDPTFNMAISSYDESTGTYLRYPSSYLNQFKQFLGSYDGNLPLQNYEFAVIDTGGTLYLGVNWGSGWDFIPGVNNLVLLSNLVSTDTFLLISDGTFYFWGSKEYSGFKVFKEERSYTNDINNQLTAASLFKSGYSITYFRPQYINTGGNNFRTTITRFGGVGINSKDQLIVGGPTDRYVGLYNNPTDYDNYYITVKSISSLTQAEDTKLHVYDYGEPRRNSAYGEHIGAIGSIGDVWYFSLSNLTDGYYGRIIKSTQDPFQGPNTQNSTTLKIKPNTNWEVVDWGSSDNKFDHHFFMTGSSGVGFFYGSGAITKVYGTEDSGYDFYPNSNVTADTVYPIKTLTTNKNRLTNLISSSYTTGSVPQLSYQILNRGDYNIIDDGVNLYSVLQYSSSIGPNSLTGSLDVSTDKGETWDTYPLSINEGLIKGISKYKNTFYLRPYPYNDGGVDADKVYYSNDLNSNNWTEIDLGSVFGSDGDWGVGFEYYNGKFYTSNSGKYSFNLTQDNNNLSYGWSDINQLGSRRPLSAGTKKTSKGVTITPSYGGIKSKLGQTYVLDGLMKSIDNGFNFSLILDDEPYQFVAVETDGKENWIALTTHNVYYISTDNGQTWESKDIVYLNQNTAHYYSDVLYFNGKWLFSPTSQFNSVSDPYTGGARKLISTLNPFNISPNWKIERTFNEDIYNMHVFKDALILKGTTHYYKMTIS